MEDIKMSIESRMKEITDFMHAVDNERSKLCTRLNEIDTDMERSRQDLKRLGNTLSALDNAEARTSIHVGNIRDLPKLPHDPMAYSHDPKARGGGVF